MKYLLPFQILFYISLSATAQQFLWAEGYDIPECNEVAAVAADTNGNAFITGVYQGQVFLPYTGDAYILKASPQGEEEWINFLSGSLQIGDIAVLEENAVIIGQSNGPFSYKDITYGSDGFFLFMLMVDAEGEYLWHYTDETLYGTHGRLEAGKQGSLAVFARGESNMGDWVILFDNEGSMLNAKLLSPLYAMIVDMAYYNNRVYLNGSFMGVGSVLIDTILIQQPPFENATFTLALDEELVAAWVATDTAINNNDGKVVVSNSGVYSYSSIIEPPFNLVNVIKRFNHEGELLKQVEVPLFSNGVSHYPDMAINSEYLALFVNNDFSFNSHKVIFYDHSLNLIDEKLVDGSSDLYSGNLAPFEEDFFIAHVYSGDLNFNDEISLSYTGVGKNPYIARLGDPSVTSSKQVSSDNERFSVFPNPAAHFITVAMDNTTSLPVRLTLHNLQGMEVGSYGMVDRIFTIPVSSLASGVYVFRVTYADQHVELQKVLIH